MQKNDRQLGTPFVDYRNTKANIEAIQGLVGGETAYAIDTGQDGYYNHITGAWVWLTNAGGGGTSIHAQDEGVPLGVVTTFNFVGAPVEVSVSGTVARVFITGSSGGSSVHNDLTGLQGGQANQYFHLTSEQTNGLVSGSYTSLHQHSGTFATDVETGYRIEVSVDSSDLIVALKNSAGNDPTVNAPVRKMIGGVMRTITSALSVTATDATNWFSSGSANFATFLINYFVYLGYNATDGIVIGFSPIPYARKYSDFSTTNTNRRFCKISDITTAASTDDYINIGRFSATLSAGAGYTWSISGTGDVISQPTFVTDTLSYAPTPSAKASMTWTSVSIQYAKYKLVYSDCFLSVSGSGTTGGTASNELYLSTPFDAVDSSSYNFAGRARDATSGVVPLANGGVVTNIYYGIKSDNTNYGLGTGRFIFGSGWYPLA